MHWDKVIFLAHAKEDKPKVIRLYHDLKKEGFEPWLDEFSLQPGENWEIKIMEAITKSRIFIACISKNSDRDGYFNKEYRKALQVLEEKKPNTTYFIPGFLDDKVEPPDFQVGTVNIKDYHAAKLYTEEGKKLLFNMLITDVTQRLAESGSPTQSRTTTT